MASAIGYDPEIDLDWDAPCPEGLSYRGDFLSTLYGTQLWSALSKETLRRLDRAEAADALGFAYVAKTFVSHLLLRDAAEQPQESAELRRTLAEVADNARHLIMFGRALELLGDADRALGPAWVRRVVPFGELLEPRALTWALVLLVNETLLGEHRELEADPTVQPLMRMIGRIHSHEQARHIAHARTELFRSVGHAGQTELAATQAVLAGAALAIRYLKVRPGAYRAAGISPYLAWMVALGNPVYSERLARQAERMVATFQEAGMIEGPLLRSLWRHAGFLRSAS